MAYEGNESADHAHDKKEESTRVEETDLKMRTWRIILQQRRYRTQKERKRKGGSKSDRRSEPAGRLTRRTTSTMMYPIIPNKGKLLVRSSRVSVRQELCFVDMMYWILSRASQLVHFNARARYRTPFTICVNTHYHIITQSYLCLTYFCR
jgi:hypothetical protein